MKKILRGLPLLALAGACAAIFFGQESVAAPQDCKQFQHDQHAYRKCKAALNAKWEENYSTQECTPWAVAPCDGEENHWVATRFEPSAYPFVASEVSYTLAGNRVDAPRCDSTLGHRASVYIGGSAPESDPVILQTFEVAGDPSATNDRPITLWLMAPTELKAGEYLYVSIQNAGNATAAPSCNEAGNYTCVSTCRGTENGDASFWSNADAPPFSWQTLASFGIAADARIGVYGFPY